MTRFFVASLFVLLTIGGSAHAYVFDYNNSGMAAYIRGTGAYTLQNSQAYSRTSGSQTNFADGVQYGFSGEVGAQFNLSNQIGVRLGFEGYQGKSIDANGARASDGVQLMTVNSLAMVLNPNLGLQYYLVSGSNARIYLLLDGGYAMATVSNGDNFTSTGLTQYGASGNFTEKWSGNTVSYVAGLGAEYHAFNNATLAIEAGYRYMQFDEFKYASSGSAVRGSSVTTVNSGSIVTDNGGGRVSLNMSGLFAGVVLRFYMPAM